VLIGIGLLFFISRHCESLQTNRRKNQNEGLFASPFRSPMGRWP
jgi:hypothetical protein